MLTVYPARKVITMNPSQPEATAVAVRDDRIVEVGSMESLQPWLASHEYQIDDRFSDRVLLPGFIDPHLHPAMAAVILPRSFITARPWRLPWGDVPATTNETGFTDRLQALDTTHPPEEPLLIWGYHQLWHGEMSRERINAVNANRPIVVWHRSFHELYLNDGACNCPGEAWDNADCP